MGFFDDPIGWLLQPPSHSDGDLWLEPLLPGYVCVEKLMDPDYWGRRR